MELSTVVRIILAVIAAIAVAYFGYWVFAFIYALLGWLFALLNALGCAYYAGRWVLAATEPGLASAANTDVSGDSVIKETTARARAFGSSIAARFAK